MTRARYIDTGTTAGSGGGPAVGDVVHLGPEYGEPNPLTVGAQVKLGSMSLGPFATPAVGAQAKFGQLNLGPFTPLSIGAAVAFQSLGLGPFATPTVGAAVAGALVLTGLNPSEDTYFDENLGGTVFGAAQVLVATTDTAIGGAERIIYLAWDLTGFAGTTINVATLNLTTRTANTTPENAPFAVLTNAAKPFEEDTATWNNSQPPPGTSRQTGTVPAPTAFAAQSISLNATARANMPGNWMILRVNGAAALGLSSINVASKEHLTTSFRPTLDMQVTL